MLYKLSISIVSKGFFLSCYEMIFDDFPQGFKDSTNACTTSKRPTFLINFTKIEIFSHVKWKTFEVTSLQSCLKVGNSTLFWCALLKTNYRLYWKVKIFGRLLQSQLWDTSTKNHAEVYFSWEMASSTFKIIFCAIGALSFKFAPALEYDEIKSLQYGEKGTEVQIQPK